MLIFLCENHLDDNPENYTGVMTTHPDLAKTVPAQI
jgi:hypothetical protein